MAVRVGINGFGRIGRLVARCLLERPDEFDPHRSPRKNLAFGRGAHTCLGKNLALTELVTAITALVDRLPNLRLDPDAEPPQIIGLYERGPTAVPVVWG